ncbi:MAG: hypothetical protein FWD14_00200 [Treponema sp.]|nr:hypothetical protein [Treponema sp.]
MLIKARFIKKVLFLFCCLFIFLGINISALSVNSTAVPYTTGLRLRDNPFTSANVLGYLGLWEKLVLHWENKTIEIFDNVKMSENGRVLVFNWLDTSTIRRDSREGTLTGVRRFFVYDFSRLYYEKNGTGIEVNLITGEKTNHQVNRPPNNFIRYIGNFIFFGGSPDGTRSPLYNTTTRQFLTLTSIRFFTPGDPNADTYNTDFCSPRLIIDNRYLIIERFIDFTKTYIIYDLVTNQQQEIYPSGGVIHYGEDRYTRYFFDHNDALMGVRFIDFNNFDIFEFKLGEQPRRIMNSASYSGYTITDSGLVQFQFGNQAWMAVRLFNFSNLQFRFDDRTYRGIYQMFVMNK